MPPKKQVEGDQEGAASLFAVQVKQKSDAWRATADQKLKDKGGGDAIWRSLGGARKQDAFDMKLIALTDPESYSRMRSEAMKSVKEATEKSYVTSYLNLMEAGASVEYAKEHAKKAAKITMDAQEAQMKIRFPDEDTKVYTNKAARDAAAFV
jgi:hypothetical protein